MELGRICWGQSVDLRNPWIALRNLWIHTLHRNPLIAQESVDRSTDLSVLCNNLNSISLLWTNISGQVALFDRWTIPEVSVVCEAHVPNHSRITAATGRDGVLHRACRLFRRRWSDSVSWVVEVSKGYQSIHIICLRQWGITISVMICSIRKIWQNPRIAQATTLRNPWIPARSKDQ